MIVDLSVVHFGRKICVYIVRVVCVCDRSGGGTMCVYVWSCCGWLMGLGGFHGFVTSFTRRQRRPMMMSPAAHNDKRSIRNQSENNHRLKLVVKPVVISFDFIPF